MHPYLEILDHKILWYNIMTVGGLAAAYLYLYYAFASLGFSRGRIFFYLALGLAVQYLGGMLIPFLYRWIYRGQTPWLNVWEKGPGRYFHSVFLSMILFTVIFAKVSRWPVKKVLDRFVIAAMIASAVGRVGCYLQGCCRGKPSDIFCAIRFPRDPLTPLHPVQVYMFLLESLIVAVLFLLLRRRHADGEIFWKGLGIYSLYRFLIEFLRTNPVFVLGLTHAQVFSLLSLALSVYGLTRPKSAPAPLPAVPKPRKRK